MHIDSARDLKRRLMKDVGEAMRKLLPEVIAKPRGLTLARAFSATSGADAGDPLVALGLSQRGTGRRTDTRIAVRVQQRYLEDSPLIDLIRAKARREIEVRYIGRAYCFAKAHKPAKATRARRAGGDWPRSRERPLLIGSSIGFVHGGGFAMAGTIGCFVRPSESDPSGPLHVLSNNHVLADENRLAKGSPILQPGELDGGEANADVVARLSKFARLHRLPKRNVIDAAIAVLEKGVDADSHRITGLGRIGGVRTEPLMPGTKLAKTGRTTGTTRGVVTAIEVDNVRIHYDMGEIGFDNQIEIEGAGTKAFSDPGDSGSIIVDDELNVVALLFAGSDHGGSNAHGLTYANPFSAVCDALDIGLALS